MGCHTANRETSTVHTAACCLMLASTRDSGTELGEHSADNSRPIQCGQPVGIIREIPMTSQNVLNTGILLHTLAHT